VNPNGAANYHHLVHPGSEVSDDGQSEWVLAPQGAEEKAFSASQ